MQDTSHLVALHESLSREKSRLAAATTSKERAFRTFCIEQKEREIAGEYKFLGMEETLLEISADELMAELFA